MLRRIEAMRGHPVQATDGEIGEVEDFYFDDIDWRIRYLVVSTRKWFGKDVLVAPDAFESVDWESGQIHVSLTKEQVKSAPPVSDKRPISRKLEATYRGFFGWPMYWVPYGIDDTVVNTGQLPPNTGLPVLGQVETGPKSDSEDVSRSDVEEYHLWSMKDLEEFEIQALDGPIGHVEDFFIEDTDMEVRYIVVDTRKWLPGKDIPIHRDLVQGLEWENDVVAVKLTRHQIEHAPEYEGGLPSSEYQRQLQDYFMDRVDPAG